MSRLKSLKVNFLKNKILVENFSFLSALQVSNLVLFLITVPYLFRVLGSRNYGLIVFAQTIAFYFSIFVNFGFNLTATRDISVNRDDKIRISEIVSSVLTIKTIFFLISLFLMGILTFLIQPLGENKLLFMYSMIACLSEALFPVWYFQGIEKMKYITFINILTRILATIMVFILIDTKDEYVIYPVILGIGTVTGAILALAIVFRKHRINFRVQPVSVLLRFFRENILYFFSNISTQVYVNANKIIIGSFLGMVSLAYYDVAEKIINIAKVPYSLLGQTLFPGVARDKNLKFINRIMLYTVIYTLLLIMGIYFLSDILIVFLSGSSNPETMNILRILALSLLPISISLFYGDLLLINLNLKMQYARMRFLGLVVYLLLFLILNVSNHLGVEQIAFMVVIVEIVMTAYSYYLVKRNLEVF